MKKLLVVAKSLGGGGSEVALIEFLNHLDESKFDVTLLLLDKDMEYRYRLKKKIKIKYIKFDDKFYYLFASMYALPGKIIKKIKLNKYFPIYDYLAMHCKMPCLPNYDMAIDFYGYGSFTTAFVALNVKANKKAFWINEKKMPWIINVDKYFDVYDKIFGVSQAIKRTFTNIYPQYKEKADVFYNVIDIENIRKKATEFYPTEFTKNTFNIVTVGRLTEQKGYDVSIKAAKKLCDKEIKFKWFAIGDGKDRYKLEKLIKKLNLSNNFILLGRRDNPYPYIKNCDIYIQFSRHEGYGLSVLEARALDKPIIVSNLPVFKEQITDKKNGIVAHFDENSLFRSIEELYQNDKLKNEIKANVLREKINFDGQMSKLDCI